MRQPFGLLLPVVLASVRCAGAACDPNGQAVNELPGLTPPDPGKTFTSCYGRTVERLTDHAKDGVSYIQAEYATQSHLNADGTLVKLEFPDGTVHFLRRATREWLKPTLRASQLAMWHPSDPNLLLYVEESGGGVEIRRLDVVADKASEEFRTRDYKTFQNLGKADISPDGNKLVYVATTRGGNERHIVVYHRDRGRLGDRALDVTNRAVNWVQVTDTRVLVGYHRSPDNCAPDIPEVERFFDREGKFLGCQPVRIFGTDLQPVWDDGKTLLAPYWGHGDVGVDSKGREVWVSANASLPVPDPKRFAGATAPAPDGCWNSLVLNYLDRPSPPVCLKAGPRESDPAFSWDLAMHIAMPARRSDWVYVTFYRTQGDTQYAALTPPTPGPPCPQCTVPFQNEIIRVRLDGKGFERLTHHHSSRHLPARGDSSYTWQPRASVDAGGRWLLFNSNFGAAESALGVDVYCLGLDGK